MAPFTRDDWLSGGLAAGVAQARAQFDPLLGSDEHADFMRLQKWREAGSPATFVAAVVQLDATTTTCQVLSIGDSIMMIAEPGSLTRFPLTSSSDFAVRTDTVRTHDVRLNHRQGRYELPADSIVVLASDAIAQCLLLRHERGTPLGVCLVDGDDSGIAGA